MPFLPAAFTLASAASSDAQSVTDAGSTPAALEHRLVVVEGEGVRADRRAVGLPVQRPRGHQVRVTTPRRRAHVGVRPEHPGLGERGDHRVVDDQHLRRGALLRGEQHLVGEVGGVVGLTLDLHPGLRRRTPRSCAPTRSPSANCGYGSQTENVSGDEPSGADVQAAADTASPAAVRSPETAARRIMVLPADLVDDVHRTGSTFEQPRQGSRLNQSLARGVWPTIVERRTGSFDRPETGNGHEHRRDRQAGRGVPQHRVVRVERETAGVRGDRAADQRRHRRARLSAERQRPRARRGTHEDARAW